jgi:hypothetical protein
VSAQWKKFTGSEEQVVEIFRADGGWIVKFKAGYESSVQYCDFKQSGFDSNDITHYMICQPHPPRRYDHRMG